MVNHFGGSNCKRALPLKDVIKYMQKNFELDRSIWYLILGQDITVSNTNDDKTRDDNLSYKNRIAALNFYTLVKRVFVTRSFKNETGQKMVCIRTIAALMHEMRMKINSIMMGVYGHFTKNEISRFLKLMTTKENSARLQQKRSKVEKLLFEDFSLMVTY